MDLIDKMDLQYSISSILSNIDKIEDIPRISNISKISKISYFFHREEKKIFFFLVLENF